MSARRPLKMGESSSSLGSLRLRGNWHRSLPSRGSSLPMTRRSSDLVLDEDFHLFNYNASVSTDNEIEDELALFKTTIKEILILAETSKRNGNTWDEAQAYWKIAKICVDIFQKPGRAVPYLKKYVILAKQTDNAKAEALGFNFLSLCQFSSSENIAQTIETILEQKNSIRNQTSSMFIGIYC
jgi:hypothetical protein